MAWWIFQSLVTTAALAAAVALVCRFGRIGPVARHALWVIVLVKFVMPPLVVWPWAAPDPFGLDRREVTEAATLEVAEMADRDLGTTSAAEVAEVATLPVAASSESRGEPSLQMSTVLVAFWIAGSVCLLTIEGVRLLRRARRVAAALPADPAIERRVAALAGQLGVSPVPVLALPGATSPVVWCLGRPKLLWPADLGDQSDACIDGLIVHELAHIARRDHIVGWIELVAGVAWWWNPLFWSVRRALREQAELACDAWVISALPNGGVRAESLLVVIAGAAPAASISAVVGIRASSRRVLERRLVRIMKVRAPLRLHWAGFIALAVVAMATFPAWASVSNDQQPAPVATVAQQPTPVPVVVPAPAQAKPQPTTKPAPTAAPARKVTPAPAGSPHEGVPVTPPHWEITHVQEPPRATRHVAVTPSTDTCARHNAETGSACGLHVCVRANQPHRRGQKLIEKFNTQREAIRRR